MIPNPSSSYPLTKQADGAPLLLEHAAEKGEANQAREAGLSPLDEEGASVMSQKYFDSFGSHDESAFDSSWVFKINAASAKKLFS